jgi:5-hydroxyisourate hydrolase
MSGISTHVLDVVLGKPAAGIAVKLEKREESTWALIRESATDVDGRCGNLANDAGPGQYRLTLATGAYLEQQGRGSIYPEICIAFNCGDGQHYHLPLLLSDNSYTTYRGS